MVVDVEVDELVAVLAVVLEDDEVVETVLVVVPVDDEVSVDVELLVAVVAEVELVVDVVVVDGPGHGRNRTERARK